MNLKIVVMGLFFSFLHETSLSQGARVTTQNSIGWYNAFGTIKLSGKFGLHAEYQWRRTDFVKNWQQGLLRAGVNYHASPRLLLRLGYAWIETFPYGDISINALGRDFTEHRIFEMAQLNQQEGIVELTHRLMLEQRFVGRYSSPSFVKEDDYPLLNRIRYLLRFQIPFSKKNNTKDFYVAMYDEVFIGFGKNVANNVFDQNRIGVLFGRKINKTIKLELGYLNQMLQLGRRINDKNVFQANNGIILNAHFNLDLTGR